MEGQRIILSFKRFQNQNCETTISKFDDSKVQIFRLQRFIILSLKGDYFDPEVSKFQTLSFKLWKIRVGCR